MNRTARWSDYSVLARQLADRQIALHEAEKRHHAVTAQIATKASEISSQLDEQAADLADLCDQLGTVCPPLSTHDAADVLDAANGLRMAGESKDIADRQIDRIYKRAYRPRFLPNAHQYTRTGAIYALWALPIGLIPAILTAFPKLDVKDGIDTRLDETLGLWSFCVMPLMAVIAARLTINFAHSSRLTHPDHVKKPPPAPRHLPKTGIAICYLLPPIVWFPVSVAAQYLLIPFT